MSTLRWTAGKIQQQRFIMLNVFKVSAQKEKAMLHMRPEVAKNQICEHDDCGEPWKEHWATPQKGIPAGACPTDKIVVK